MYWVIRKVIPFFPDRGFNCIISHLTSHLGKPAENVRLILCCSFWLPPFQIYINIFGIFDFFKDVKVYGEDVSTVYQCQTGLSNLDPTIFMMKIDHVLEEHLKLIKTQ